MQRICARCLSLLVRAQHLRLDGALLHSEAIAQWQSSPEVKAQLSSSSGGGVGGWSAALKGLIGGGA